MTTEEENSALLEDIIQQLKSPDCEIPENILLLGKSGAGKSALVNTVHKVLTEKYLTIATHGRGGEEKSLTTDLLRYDSCGVVLHRVSRKKSIADVVCRLPNILDCAGLENENTPELREKLELLICGYIWPGMSIKAIDDMQRDYGIGNLKKILNQNQSWKISKIVFMHDGTDIGIPKNLIQCIKEILKTYDPITLVRKCQCDVFILITKYDRVRDSDETSLPAATNHEDTVSIKEYEEVENIVKEEFSFVGASSQKMFRWVSFSDSIGYENAEVDKIALNFLKKMIQPGLPKTTAPKHPFLNCSKTKRLGYRCLNVCHRSSGCIVFLSVLILVGAFFYKLLHSGIQYSSRSQTFRRGPPS